MPAASPAMLLWWLAASLSSAVYFHPDVMLDERTDLSRFVRSLHVTTCAAMASLAVAALFPSRIDVALSCAGDAPEALRCLTAYGLVYVCGLLCLLLETLLRHGLFSRACAMRISQAALASLFGQVVSHRGELLCASQKSGETPRARLTFCAVYAWAALAFQLCNRIEASLDDRALDGESDDDYSDDDDVEVRCGVYSFSLWSRCVAQLGIAHPRVELAPHPRRRRVTQRSLRALDPVSTPSP